MDCILLRTTFIAHLWAEKGHLADALMATFGHFFTLSCTTNMMRVL